MHDKAAYQEIEIPQYVKSLLYSKDKKVCTNLASESNRSYDEIYNEITEASKSPESTINILKSMAESSLNQNNLYLIFDDTQANKQYSKEIEGVEVGFDGSTHRPVAGLKMVTCILSDTNINIPINAVNYVSKELAGSLYKTKSEIASVIAQDLINTFPIRRLLADAHYATKNMIAFLNEHKVSFLMKIPCNRIVTIGDYTGQLKQIFRLKKNSHLITTKGVFNGVECFFHVVKLSDHSIAYFISNDYIDSKALVKLYRIRWNIEIFHRTAKQYLGFSHCQMRSIEKQRQHMLFVMYAYAIASILHDKQNFHCVEDIIKHLRIVKHVPVDLLFSATKENLC